MSTEIVLYRGDSFTAFGRIPLVDVLRLSMGKILARPIEAAVLTLVLIDVPEQTRPIGKPKIHNLMAGYGYAAVIVQEGGRIVYRHPHPLSELIADPLREVLAESHPEEEVWGFAISGPGLPRASVIRPEPEVQGLTELEPIREGSGPGFRIRRIPDEPLPEADLAELGATPDERHAGAFAKILVPSSLRNDLMGGRRFSDQVEEGGFLIGRPYRERGTENLIIEVTAALPAEHSGASLLHFTFTGDSFEAVKKELREKYAGHRLLGWYHTHLFAAAEEMGLSSVDLRLHFTTFRQPWQVAGLVNLDGSSRVLRFYVRQGDRMVLCPQWVIDERG